MSEKDESMEVSEEPRDAELSDKAEASVSDVVEEAEAETMDSELEGDQDEGQPAAPIHAAQNGIAAEQERLHDEKGHCMQQEDHERDLQVVEPRREHDAVKAPENRRKAAEQRTAGSIPHVGHRDSVPGFLWWSV